MILIGCVCVCKTPPQSSHFEKYSLGKYSLAINIFLPFPLYPIGIEDKQSNCMRKSFSQLKRKLGFKEKDHNSQLICRGSGVSNVLECQSQVTSIMAFSICKFNQSLFPKRHFGHYSSKGIWPFRAILSCQKVPLNITG